MTYYHEFHVNTDSNTYAMPHVMLVSVWGGGTGVRTKQALFSGHDSYNASYATPQFGSLRYL